MEILAILLISFISKYLEKTGGPLNVNIWNIFKILSKEYGEISLKYFVTITRLQIAPEGMLRYFM